MNRRITKSSVAAACVVAAAITAGGTGVALAQGQSTALASVQHAGPASSVSLKLQASSAELKECFPYAKATVKVGLTTDAIGKDSFTITASGLKPKTDFTVFLIEKAGSPFGAVEYIGDITTDKYGEAKNTFDLIVEEAFAFNNETLVRKELNSVGFWFADPKDDDGCLGAGSPTTQFDGDASAGVQMMNSGSHLLP
jgi:hypothetical protein